MSEQNKFIPKEARMSTYTGGESVLDDERKKSVEDAQLITPEMVAKVKEQAGGKTSDPVSKREALSSNKDWASKNVEIGADVRAAAMELAAESERSTELRTSTIDAMMGKEVLFEVSDGTGAKGELVSRNEDGSEVTVKVVTKKAFWPLRQEESVTYEIDPDQIQGFDEMMKQNQRLQEMGTQSTG